MPQVDELTLVVNSNVGGAVAGLKTVSAQANKTGEKVGRAFTKMGGAATAAGKTLTMGLTLPILAAGVAVLKLGSDAESAFANLEANAGISGEALEEVKAQLGGVAAMYGTDIPSAAEATFTLWSAGIHDVNQLMADTETVLKATATGLGDQADLAGFAAVAYSNFGLSATESMDILAVSAANAIVPPEEMIKVFSRVSGTANAAGMSLDTLAASAVILTNATGKVELAGTQMDGIMRSIIRVQPAASSALEEIGLSVPDFKKLMADDPIAAIQSLDGAFAEVGMDTDTWLAKIFPDSQAMIGAATLLGTDTADAVGDAIANREGALDGSFAVIEDTAAFQMKQTLATVKNFAAEIGMELLEMITPFIPKLRAEFQKIIDLWDSFSEETKLNIFKAIGAIAALGPALLIFGKLSTIIGTLLPFIIKIGAAFLTMNPIVLAIAAVVAILAGAFFAMGGDMEKLKEIGIAVWEKLQVVAAIAVEMLKQLMAGLAEFWEEHGAAIIATFQKIGDFITEAIETLVAFLEPIFSEFAAAMEAVFGDLVAWFQDNWPAIQETVEIVMGHIQDVIDRVLPHVQKIFEAVVGFIGTYVKVIFELMAEQIRVVMNIIKGIIEVVMGIIRGDWTMVWNGIKRIMDGIWDGLFAIVDTALTLIKKAIGLAWTVITEGLQLLFTALDKIWDTGWNAMKDVVSDIWSGIGDIIKGAFKGALNWVIEKINWAIDKLNGLIRGLNKTPFVNIPEVANIPGLRDGGQVSSGGMVKVGETGPEVVTLPKGASVTPLRGGGGGGEGASVHIENMYSGADPFELADAIGWELMKRGN